MSAIDDLLAERAEWLRVDAYDGPYGTWEICLRLDGSYAHAGLVVSRQESVEYWREVVMNALAVSGFDLSRLQDWAAPR